MYNVYTLQISKFNTNHFSDGFLCIPSSIKILGSVHDPSLARQGGSKTSELHTWQGKPKIYDALHIEPNIVLILLRTSSGET